MKIKYMNQNFYHTNIRPQNEANLSFWTPEAKKSRICLFDKSCFFLLEKKPS